MSRNKKQKEKHAAEQRKYRQRYKERAAAIRRRSYQKHRERWRSFFKRRREERISKGLCAECGRNKEDLDFKLCRKCRESYHKIQLKKKLRVLRRISGLEEPRCRICGCNDIRVLEVNHKKGGGVKEMKKLPSPAQFYRNILTGRREIDDLEVLCKPCNILEYCKRKFNLTWKIEWVA